MGGTPHATGAVNVPIYQSSTFAFRDSAHGAALFAGNEQGYIYTRIGNPTIAALEQNVTSLERLDRVRLATLAVSLGGVETLIEHPASMTHASMSKAAREAAGFSDSLVRYSVGIEDVDDLIADLDEALAAIH